MVFVSDNTHVVLVELVMWQSAPGSTVLPRLREPVGENTVFVKCEDIEPNTLLFLPVIPQDLDGWSTHNAIDLDP